MIELEPPEDRVLLREHARETEIAGIVLPEIAQERSRFATVLAVGAGTPDPFAPLGRRWLGEFVQRRHGPMTDYGFLEPGDVVIMPEVGGTELEWEGHGTVISILASQLLARVGSSDG